MPSNASASISPMTDTNQAYLRDAVQDGTLRSLRGQVICFTGTMSLSRNDMDALVKALGGQTSVLVDSHTTLLVCADVSSGSRKLLDARARGLRVVSEATFTMMLESVD